MPFESHLLRGSKTAQAAKRAVRRERLVAVVLQGKSITQAARENNVSRRFASQEVHAAESTMLISEMVDEQTTQIKELLKLSLAAIADCLHPTHFVLLEPRKGEKKGRSVEMSNDPRVRLLAAKRVLDIAVAGRGKEDAPKDAAEPFTWDKFMSVYALPEEDPKCNSQVERSNGDVQNRFLG